MVSAYKRVQEVRLIAAGRTVKDVAQIVGVSEQTIYSWVNCDLQEHAAAALFDEPGVGRPPVAPGITAAWIKREFGRDPLRLGYQPPSGRFRC
jgi:transposase